LIDVANKLGAGVSTAADALDWIRSQSNMTVLNSNYPSIVTNGLVLNLDASFVSSYPKTGTTWTDLSGNGSNGTLLNGVSYSGTNYGSLVFDGTNDSIQVTTSSTLQLTGLTINIWYNSAVSSNTALTFPTSGSAFILHFRGAGFYLTASDGSVSGYLAWNSPTTNLPANQWLMLTATWDGSTMKLYYNSTKQTSELSFSGGVNNRLNNISAINIGTFFNSSQPWANGNIMSYSLYNRALSQEEITQNYNAGLQRFIPTNGLVLSLDAQNTNLYATSPTTAYDVSGNDNNGTLINGTQYVADGDGSWRFDGVDDQITNIGTVSTFSFIQNTGIFTICTWVRLTDLSAPSYFLGNNDGTASSKGFYLGYQGSGGRLWLSITYGVGGQATLNLQRNNFFLDDNWVFVTAVGNGTTCQFYRNGQTFSTSGTFGTFSTGDSTRTLGLGRINNFNGSYWEGNVSQTQIYNRALTQNEITTIYNATKSRYGIQ